MKDSKYPDGSKEPDKEYNDYVNANSKKIEEFQCKGNCEGCGECGTSDNHNDPMDDMLLNSSALTKNSDKETKYTYTNEETVKKYNDMIYNDSSTKPAKKYKTFKEQWLEEDEKCDKCGLVIKEAKGLTKQNMKKLISFKGTPEGWIIFILLCAFGFTANLSWDLMTTPINCSNASNIIVDGQYVNGNNQMPIIDENDLNISYIDAMPINNENE